jgi:hypothetical protein
MYFIGLRGRREEVEKSISNWRLDIRVQEILSIGGIERHASVVAWNREKEKSEERGEADNLLYERTRNERIGWKKDYVAPRATTTLRRLSYDELDNERISAASTISRRVLYET